MAHLDTTYLEVVIEDLGGEGGVDDDERDHGVRVLRRLANQRKVLTALTNQRRVSTALTNQQSKA